LQVAEGVNRLDPAAILEFEALEISRKARNWLPARKAEASRFNMFRSIFLPIHRRISIS
jgi:hypothetical protein